MIRVLSMVLLGVLALSACSKSRPAKVDNQWDNYYARLDTPQAHVKVVPPEGTTVPMAKLIAEYVVEELRHEDIQAEVSSGRQGQGRHFILTGRAERNTDPRVKYHRILRWVLSDATGQVISTHSHGVSGSVQDWDFGSAQLLASIGIGTAGPVSQMVKNETKVAAPIDPLQRGLLVDPVAGLTQADSDLVLDAIAGALRTSDVLVTGDPRQAAFRLAGRFELSENQPGIVDVRIIWRVLTMDGQEVGSAVQDNRLTQNDLVGGWGPYAPKIGKAAAVGVEHVFGLRSGPAPGAPNRAKGQPPAIVLPGQPGRAIPPPQ
ncbi:hypothetical protein V5T82_15600 [Magnetovibrio sp. PR-2]|uniref:hypothetical protein n=1 Tax=Magnetovibrio sp. PR-2 TaxID=3120356 RepID=UPI002FCE3CE7